MCPESFLRDPVRSQAGGHTIALGSAEYGQQRIVYSADMSESRFEKSLSPCEISSLAF